LPNFATHADSECQIVQRSSSGLFPTFDARAWRRR
jgi:hypothetical protein